MPSNMALLLASVADASTFLIAAAWGVYVHRMKSLDPERLSVAHVLHIEVCVLLKELDGSAWIRENVERAAVVRFPPCIAFLHTIMLRQAIFYFPLCTSNVYFVITRGGDLVDAPDEGNSNAVFSVDFYESRHGLLRSMALSLAPQEHLGRANAMWGI